MSEEPGRRILPERPAESARPLEYTRRGYIDGYASPLPVAAGYAIGIGVYLACGACWWMAAASTRSLVGILCGLFGGVPLLAMILAVYLQVRFEWRGVVAGVMTALGL